MCGLFISNDPKVDEASYPQIIERLGFRGPDYHSPLINFKGWKLFHARLSIIAISDCYQQPYFGEDGSVILFNGEILNYSELAKMYNLERNQSDTEVLSQLLTKPDFDLNMLDGFFAFVRISSDGELTHCARDRFGVKPLVYHKNDEFLTISSEASIISDIFDLEFCAFALEEYKAFRYPIFQGTYFNNIHQIDPGNCLVNGAYFEPLDYFNQYKIAEDDILNSVETAVESGITSRLVSDVPIGLLFSGGIDSNLIRQTVKVNLRKLTGGTSFDYDVKFAQKLADADRKKDFEIVHVSKEDFKTRFDDMVRLRKEPLSVPNEVILSYVAERWVEHGGKVLLSGEAADEFFAGYDRVYRWAASTDSFNLEEFLKLYCYTEPDSISAELKEKLKRFFASIDGLSPFEMVRYFFIKKHLPILFRRLDFSLMYAGVEGREPLASFEVFKIAMQIQPEFLFKKNLGKAPLRDLIEREMGSEFAYSQKVGFPVDLSEIFRNKKGADRMQNYEIWYEENLRSLL